MGASERALNESVSYPLDRCGIEITYAKENN